MDDNINDHKQVRLSVKVEVLINNAVKGHALDISEGGMFIYTHVQIPKGKMIELNFTLDEGGPPIKTQACVQFVQEGVGIRVEFTNLSPVNIERLKK
ncbi:MAG TPA: PilZ domain-containing protein, partial [Nitrospiria bacterium]|nr:PilZ domain-containing protein [Nitrospiria bacterium]